MTLTPSKIRGRQFTRARRGFADNEVKMFLHEVGDQVERLVAENDALSEASRGRAVSGRLRQHAHGLWPPT